VLLLNVDVTLPSLFDVKYIPEQKRLHSSTKLAKLLGINKWSPLELLKKNCNKESIFL